jgi:hypothetical protein
MIRSAVDLVPGAAAGGVSISSGGAGGAHGSTSEQAADLDALQHHHAEGPCLSALHGPRPELAIVMAQDLAGWDEARWPQFAPAAVELGFPAALSLQLPAASGVGAALNLYGRTAGGFQLADLVLADTFVGHLASLLFGAVGRPSSSRGGTGPRQEAELRQRLDRPALEP